MLDVIIWGLFRRLLYRLRYKGFRASLLSYADKNSSFSQFNRLAPGSIVKHSRIGEFTYIAGARVQSCSIGKFCSIGPGSRIGALGRHPVDWVSTHPVFFSTLMQAGISFADMDHFQELSPIIIGNDVWIGANVIVLDGVRIADGAIVAAGAVVTKDVEPYAIIGGVPARVIRYRFDQDTIDKLMALKWWDLPTSQLKRIAPLMRRPPSESMHDLSHIAKLRSTQEE
jgi:acetyltransferase-like isoleucine patch superfamily enzyme